MKVTAPFEPAIVVRDLERMLGFYRDVLGMQVFSIVDMTPEQSSQAGLCDGGFRIARLETDGGDRLKLAAPRDPPQPQPPVEQVLQRHGIGYLTFIVPNIARLHARLAQSGARIRTGAKPLDFRPGVVKLMFAEDPEGNLLEFLERNDLDTYRPARHA